MGTTATAVVLEGPEIRLWPYYYARSRVREDGRLYIADPGTRYLGLPIAQCVLLVGFWHSSREDMLAHENAIVFIY